jgi:hypothetical protein
MLRISLQHFAQHDSAIDELQPRRNPLPRIVLLMRRSETVQKRAIVSLPKLFRCSWRSCAVGDADGAQD